MYRITASGETTSRHLFHQIFHEVENNARSFNCNW